jgi:hypothetical protein
MPVTLGAAERDALCELAAAQLGSLHDIWSALLEQRWEEAELLFGQHLQVRRLLEGLQLPEPDKDGQVEVRMRMDELREALTRIQVKATVGLVIEEEWPEVVTSEREACRARARLAIKACERSLAGLGTRYEVHYVVVDTESDEEASGPIALRDFALDVSEVLNESAQI